MRNIPKQCESRDVSLSAPKPLPSKQQLQGGRQAELPQGDMQYKPDQTVKKYVSYANRPKLKLAAKRAAFADYLRVHVFDLIPVPAGFQLEKSAAGRQGLAGGGWSKVADFANLAVLMSPERQKTAFSGFFSGSPRFSSAGK